MQSERLRLGEYQFANTAYGHGRQVKELVQIITELELMIGGSAKLQLQEWGRPRTSCTCGVPPGAFVASAGHQSLAVGRSGGLCARRCCTQIRKRYLKRMLSGEGVSRG